MVARKVVEKIVFKKDIDEKFEEDIRKIYDISVKSFVNNFLYTEISSV